VAKRDELVELRPEKVYFVNGNPISLPEGKATTVSWSHIMQSAGYGLKEISEIWARVPVLYVPRDGGLVEVLTKDNSVSLRGGDILRVRDRN
jgi:hypothetical protein